VVAQIARLALGDDGARCGVQHDGSIGDGKYALQFVSYHHEGEPKVVPQAENGSVQICRGDGVEARRGLIEHQDVRAQGHGTGDACPLQHPARELRGHKGLRIGHLDLVQEQPSRQILFFESDVGELIEGEAHVLQHRKGAE